MNPTSDVNFDDKVKIFVLDYCSDENGKYIGFKELSEKIKYDIDIYSIYFNIINDKLSLNFYCKYDNEFKIDNNVFNLTVYLDVLFNIYNNDYLHYDYNIIDINEVYDISEFIINDSLELYNKFVDYVNNSTKLYVLDNCNNYKTFIHKQSIWKRDRVILKLYCDEDVLGLLIGKNGCNVKSAVSTLKEYFNTDKDIFIKYRTK